LAFVPVPDGRAGLAGPEGGLAEVVAAWPRLRDELELLAREAADADLARLAEELVREELASGGMCGSVAAGAWARRPPP